MKKLIFIIICLLILPGVLADWYEEDSEYRVDWSAQQGTWDFMMWDPFGSDLGDPLSYDLSWYPLQDWEYAACIMDFSPELSSNSYSYSTDNKIYGLTIYANAKKTSVSITLDDDTLEQTTLYEFEWYVQPKEDTLTYKVYKEKSDNTKVVIGSEYLASYLTGSADYYAEYSDVNYTGIIIAYDDEEYRVDIT